MDEARFWEVVDATLPFRGDRQRQRDSLCEQLSSLPPEEVAAFEGWFWQQLRRSDCSNVEGAWSVIDGSGADDGFNDFRCWLISRGRKAFEAALGDPDSLAGVVRPGEDTEFWGFGLCARAVYRERTGQDPPSDPGRPCPAPAGESWNTLDGEEVERRMPRLCRLFEGEEG